MLLHKECFIVIFIECIKWVVSQKNNVCVCAYVHTYVCAHIVIVKYFAFVLECFF